MPAQMPRPDRKDSVRVPSSVRPLAAMMRLMAISLDLYESLLVGFRLRLRLKHYLVADSGLLRRRTNSGMPAPPFLVIPIARVRVRAPIADPIAARRCDLSFSVRLGMNCGLKGWTSAESIVESQGHHS